MAGLLYWWLEVRSLPLILVLFGLIALAGALAYSRIGHDVHLLLQLPPMLIGHVISWLVVFLTYVIGIACFGTVLRVFGTNRLERNFVKNKNRATMLKDALSTPLESFMRQS